MLGLKMESLLNPESSHGIMDMDSNASSGDEEEADSSYGPLQDMSSLLRQLPSKRGLSKHYNGKSQSFTSLSAAGCLEDLAKPDNPYSKRLKTCKSLQTNSSCPSLIAKKTCNKVSAAVFSINGGGRRNSGLVGTTRPPIPPPRSATTTTTFPNQTPLLLHSVPI